MFLIELFKSIPENWYIFLNAFVVIYFWVKINISRRDINNYLKKDENEPLERKIFNRLNNSYSIFLALISIFPMLGMFGTVKALIELDLSAEMDGIKQNFFHALTSTAWGIIFAVVGKIVNAKIAPDVEEQIQKAKEILKKENEEEQNTEISKKE